MEMNCKCSHRSAECGSLLIEFPASNLFGHSWQIHLMLISLGFWIQSHRIFRLVRFFLHRKWHSQAVQCVRKRWDNR